MIGSLLLPAVLLLGVVIFVHELGHFLAAKWRGVRVLKFSLGFGPRLVGFTRGGTEYRISWVPLGGYVQMAGDTPGEDGTMPAGGPEEFLSHPWHGRFLIALAGPMANLVTAFVVFTLVGLVGYSTPDNVSVLGPMADTTAAYRYGLREGDRIVQVGSQPVSSWIAMGVAEGKHPKDQPITLRVERGGRTFDVILSRAERVPVLSGLRPPPTPPVVGSVKVGMPAYKAGLKEGDRITTIDGNPIRAWEDIPKSLRGAVDRPVRIEVLRDGRARQIVVTPMNPEGRRSGNGLIGIAPPRVLVYKERLGPLEAVVSGARLTGFAIAQVYGGFALLVKRPLYYGEYVGGPLFIIQAAGEQAREGLDAYLQFLALINIAIMAFNLLPLPVLDGGHMLLALVEGIRRQALSARAYLRFQKVGLVVLGTLFVVILAHDPFRVFQRFRALDQPSAPAPQETPIAPSPP